MKKLFLFVTYCMLPVCLMAGNDELSQCDNFISIASADVKAGSKAELSVILKTNIEAVGFQFDLYLPEGITYVYEETQHYRGLELGKLATSRKHMLSGQLQKDGALRVVCFSPSNSTFYSDEGEVAVISVNVDKNIAPGIYPAILKAVEITKHDGLGSPTVQYVATTFTVSNGTNSISSTHQNEIVNNAMFNIMGQRIPSLRPGQICIVDNKKVFVK